MQLIEPCLAKIITFLLRGGGRNSDFEKFDLPSETAVVVFFVNESATGTAIAATTPRRPNIHIVTTIFERNAR
jgi:hypothetical protein